MDEADKICPKCAGKLEEMLGQFESSEEIDVIVRCYIKLIYRRKKYRCRCNACPETALGPLKLRPGATYSINMAIDIAINKYCYHLPCAGYGAVAAGVPIQKQTPIRVYLLT